LLRHAPSLDVHDFRLAMVSAGLLSALALFSYTGLAADAGAEISGHGVRAAAK
jgi:hypothetical protein